MSPSKFSSLASLITVQSLRLRASLDKFTQIPCLLRYLLALPQVFVNRFWIVEVIRDEGVDTGQRKGVEGLDNAFGRLATLKSVNHQLQQHPALADTENARWILAQGHRDR